MNCGIFLLIEERFIKDINNIISKKLNNFLKIKLNIKNSYEFSSKY
jgi:hypothetical protein